MPDVPSDDDVRLKRVKTAMMDPDASLEPHDMAWLFRLAEEAIRERQRTRNHSEDAPK